MRRVFDISQGQSKYTYAQQIIFPSETKDEDTYAYNDADQMTEGKMDKSTEVLASLVYTRDSDGQVKKTTSKGLPGAEVTENTYDENNRLTKYGSAEYKYDSANNATKEGSSTNTYNEADELEKGTGTTYAYDELGERTKMTPEKGPATTYGYDQAGDLISVERPEKESVPKIEDSYTYDGNSLRASQTISGTTSYLAWDMAEELPLILSDGTNSYIYGPGNLPVEQISSGGTVSYVHHDQQGSTRLLTGSTGTVTGKCTYGAYGTPTCEGTATTPLGYDGQYTSSDTGLIYLQARVYDPATAQFLTVDPIYPATRAPYNYAYDDPTNYMDRTGLSSCSITPGSSENCFSEVSGAIISGVESVAQHPVEAGGVILGGVALASGAGEVAAAAGAGSQEASALGAVSAVSGLAGAGFDAVGCVVGGEGGGGVACAGALLGAVSGGGAGAVVGGFVGDEAANGVRAIGIPSGALGFLGDLANALVPASSSGASSSPGGLSGFGPSPGSGCW